MKVCRTCNETKDINEFHKQSRAKDGRYLDCKVCTAARNKAWYGANKARHAKTCASWYKKNRTHAISKGTDWHYRKNYGITHEEFLSLADKQDNKCLICSVGLTFAEKCHTRAVLDHDHDTGEIRGVLCNACNTGIGLLKDSPAVLLSAYNYLKGSTNV